ncbi:hypothetical protein R3P38DRAFT_1449623 [Favolaschia claudopus]|uniref:Secreted protein n=1 Tax=Favolaschia claudopus TaxID=2862362 RepID=A0AAW0AN26_9AGAR
MRALRRCTVWTLCLVNRGGGMICQSRTYARRLVNSLHSIYAYLGRRERGKTPPLLPTADVPYIQPLARRSVLLPLPSINECLFHLWSVSPLVDTHSPRLLTWHPVLPL